MHDSIKHTCVICDSDKLEKLAPYRGKHKLFTGCDLFQCNDCQFVFANPMPEDEALLAYNSSYFSNAHDGLPQDSLSVAYHSAINQLRAIHVEKSVDVKEISSVLEIGGGAGYFARYWKEQRPATDYYMVETDTNCHKTLRNLGVNVKQNLEQLPDDKKFDLVVMSHVLEHTNSPFEFLESISTKLKSKGILFIEVPCSDWKFKPEDEPHLLFFDKKPMGLLMEKSGFQNIRCSYHGETIQRLVSTSKLKKFYIRVRTKLLQYGLLFPFSLARGNLAQIKSPLERAIVKPFNAHLEKKQPSAWLRAVAVKK